MRFFTNISLEEVEKSTNPQFSADYLHLLQKIENFIFVFDRLITIYEYSRDLFSFLQFRKREKTPNGGLLLLVQLQASPCKFTKNNTSAWVFSTFFK